MIKRENNFEAYKCNKKFIQTLEPERGENWYNMFGNSKNKIDSNLNLTDNNSNSELDKIRKDALNKFKAEEDEYKQYKSERDQKEQEFRHDVEEEFGLSNKYSKDSLDSLWNIANEYAMLPANVTDYFNFIIKFYIEQTKNLNNIFNKYEADLNNAKLM